MKNCQHFAKLNELKSLTQYDTNCRTFNFVITLEKITDRLNHCYFFDSNERRSKFMFMFKNKNKSPMNKTILFITSIVMLCLTSKALAQSSYSSTNYAQAGDTLYLTNAQASNSNYDTTGANINWNYSSIIGVTQRQLIFRTPAQTGVVWPFVQIPSNSNLSSTDNQTITLGQFQYTNPNDFFLKNSTVLRQSASSAQIIIGNTPFTIKNQYTTPDVLIKFPIQFNNTDSSQSGYTTNIPNIYYKNSNLKRVNSVVGWGAITTPYGTFSNCLKMQSLITQIDSIVIDTLSPIIDTSYYREYKWFDPSKKYEVLYVKQKKIQNSYVTQTVEYLDNQQYFQPQALFLYTPVNPIVNDTVYFQNLSVNATSFSWDFGDPMSGLNNLSTNQNPFHIYSDTGTYVVKLIANNGPLSDTVTLPVIVRYLPIASFTYNPSGITTCDTVQFTNTSQYAQTYKWTFGDIASGAADTSFLPNPTHHYSTSGSYVITLIAYSIVGNDTIQTIINVGNCINYTVTTSSNPVAGGTTTGGGTYASGASVTVTATANNGYTFTNWTENGNVVSTNASYTFNISANRTLVANFTQNTTNYTVTTSSNPVAGGTTTGGGTYASGASVTVTATANNGYTFTNWTENGNVVSTNASYTFNISANRNLVANFDAITGLSEQNILSVFYIYPNPASTLLYFDGAGNEDFTFAIYNTTGQFLMKGKYKNQIDVSSLNLGIYFLQVIDKDGKYTRIKFIKE